MFHTEESREKMPAGCQRYEKRREIPRCAGRPLRRSEAGIRKSACSARNDSLGGVARERNGSKDPPLRAMRTAKGSDGGSQNIQSMFSGRNTGH
jgi:hypothetical protein